MSAIMVCSEDSSEKERGWTIIATKILCLSLIGVIHFQGRFWDIKLQMNCLTLSWIRSMHLNFQKVCNFLLQFRIPKKTMLNVELIEPANSKTHKKNQQVEFKTTENLIINGVVVIPKGTVGMGYVYEVQKAGGFGRKGVLRIAGKEIKTLNNVSVPLRKGLEGKGKTDGGAVAVAAAVSLVGGLFMKGSNINYPAGTDFQVEVRDNVDLGVTPEELKDAMNPDIPHGQEIVIEVK